MSDVSPMTNKPNLPVVLSRSEILGPLAALLVVYLVFCWLSPSSFAGAANLELILRQSTIVGLVSLGMTIVIIAGGIDLSIGSVVALSTVVIASLLNSGFGPVLAATGGIAVGALSGLANGFMVARFKVVPFIATLVSLLVLRGIAKGLAHEQKVDAPLTWLNELLARLDSAAAWQLVPAGVWLFLLMAALVALMLRYSRLGLHVFAVGSNVKTALLCGVNVERVELWVYSLCGAFAGLAGLMQFSRLTVGDPTVASGLELDAIAAVVIGGASLKGGRGSVAGTIIGALLMAVLRAGCTQIGLANWIQEIVTGLIILAAMGVDRLRYRQA